MLFFIPFIDDMVVLGNLMFFEIFVILVDLSWNIPFSKVESQKLFSVSRQIDVIVLFLRK